MEKEIKLNATELFQFGSFNDWVNNASKKFKPYKLLPTICIASDGSVCHIGEDFMLARDWELFPIKVYSLKRTKSSIPF